MTETPVYSYAPNGPGIGSVESGVFNLMWGSSPNAVLGPSGCNLALFDQAYNIQGASPMDVSSMQGGWGNGPLNFSPVEVKCSLFLSDSGQLFINNTSTGQFSVYGSQAPVQLNYDTIWPTFTTKPPIASTVACTGIPDGSLQAFTIFPNYSNPGAVSSYAYSFCQNGWYNAGGPQVYI